MFINDIHTYISNGQNSDPLSDRFWASGPQAGDAAQGVKDRPTVAGHFATLALQRLRNSQINMSWIQPNDSSPIVKKSAAPSTRAGGSTWWSAAIFGVSIFAVFLLD